MPAAYTHFAVAKEVFNQLPIEIQSKIAYPNLYFFGAQGADFCFFYRPFRPSETNFGRFLHNRGSYLFFETIYSVAARDEYVLSYALGYIAHYAADRTFHPYVYSLAKRSPLKHSQAEGALDFYFKSKARAHPDQWDSYFNRKLTSEELSSLYLPYALTAARADRAPVLKPYFIKSVRSYQRYTALSALSFSRNRPDLLNRERREWKYPDDPSIVLKDGAEELFSRAVYDGVALTKEFLRCLRARQPLPRSLFGKNFLSGI